MTRRDPDSEPTPVELPEPPSFRLDGRRALVAGASSGIGLGCAVALAAAGAQVTLAARTLSRLEDLAQSFCERGWRAEALTWMSPTSAPRQRPWRRRVPSKF